MANKKIGITGHNGFLGNHIKNQIQYQFTDFELLDFKRSFFEDQKQLSIFVNSCDVIIHLAGLNRHNSEQEITNTNIKLAEVLGASLTKNNFKGSLIFSSSLKENENTPYGKSKKKAGEILAKAANSLGFSFIKLIIPNIFGPFGRPYYNSFIATFSHQLIKGQAPEILLDASIPLIYVDSVVRHIMDAIKFEGIHNIEIPYQIKKKVSNVLKQLEDFQKSYIENGILPKFESAFDIQLFNSFRSAINLKEFFPISYEIHEDERGYFSELIRNHSKGQVSFSSTKPNITRGNHFHTRKIERFSVIQGEAKIALRKIGSDDMIEFELSGTHPAYVDMPVWTTHNITNIGNKDLITVFWINEHYDPEDADVFFEKV